MPRNSSRIATVSEFSKQDIHQTYNIDLDTIDVVYNGCNQLYRRLTSIEKTTIQQKYSGGNPYFLFVGLVHKRKNLENIFKAFDIFKQSDQQNTKFVIVGGLKGFEGEILEIYNQMQFKNDVVLLGRKEIQELILITGAAEAMIYASLFEGFGIPILEAFHAEIPVITSSNSSMPEIAGDAALIVNPIDPNQIAEAMVQIRSNPTLVQNLISKGRERKLNFSWDLTAQKLWNCMEKELLS